MTHILNPCTSENMPYEQQPGQGTHLGAVNFACVNSISDVSLSLHVKRFTQGEISHQPGFYSLVGHLSILKERSLFHFFKLKFV